MRNTLTGFLLCILASAGHADVTSRSGGPSESAMLVRNSDAAPDGMTFFRPVLSGVLYRAGFSGGDKNRTGMSTAQRVELCESGFETAFYADFGKNTEYGATSCGSSSLDYASARSSRPDAVMQAIYETIKAPSKGPVLVHCMWGVHASGALSAMALVQFCGWSEDRAKSYWDEARNGAPCANGCDSWIDAKFERFKLNSSLEITEAERAAICPK
ncbi:hypothetical protein OU789_00115 [Halocynthiibacter sp. C4]|uniref:hypothetical protein n=1 Tax=Halocynthiibacter sp. C4 TaxID=2992758 RepID=UPI00237BA69A|nr:hypothetical protein [Halocynthiibacter sp. C4]MDE0588323.1 hypothetical protein [Halocynthiibacter sp. C4]